MRFDVDPPCDPYARLQRSRLAGDATSTSRWSTPCVQNWGRFAAVPAPGVGLHLDLNFNFKTEGYIRLAQALEEFELVWLEVDSYDPEALATIRRSSRTPMASLESLYGRRQFRPFLEHQAVDVAIIDVAWNGILESYKIAAMADAYEVNVAPHNFNGHIGSLMSAHLCAAIPNFRVMEIDIEDVPWKDDLVTAGTEDREWGIAGANRRSAGASRSTRMCCAPTRHSRWRGGGASVPTLTLGTLSLRAQRSNLHRAFAQNPREIASPRLQRPDWAMGAKRQNRTPVMNQLKQASKFNRRCTQINADAPCGCKDRPAFQGFICVHLRASAVEIPYAVSFISGLAIRGPFAPASG